MLPFLLLVLSLWLLLLSVLTSFTRKQKKHSHVGPPSHPLIGCLISFYRNRPRLLNWYTDLLSDSLTQTIVVQRMGARRTVVTANPDNVEYILKSNFNNYPKGKPFTQILRDLLGCGIFNVDGDLWLTQRKLASHEFTTKSLRKFVVKTLQEEVDSRLIPLLESASETGIVLDLQEVFKRFSFDIVCKVSLGTDQNCLDFSRQVPPLVNAFDAASLISAMRGTATVSLAWKVKRFLNIGSEKKLREAVRLVHESVLEIVRNKKARSRETEMANGGGDLLSRLLCAGHDEEVVRDMVISFIMAGRDTTSSAMTWLFWLLCKHRDREKMIVEEVENLLGNGEGVLGYGELKGMNYLKACLCESMRLYPPVAWDSKHAANDDILPDGTPVRKGDRVTYFPYGMGRMEALWGKDRLEFKPDRWLDPGLGLKPVSPFKFPVFQAGPRMCLGKEMALLQIKFVVAAVLRRFEFVPVCKEQPVFIPLLTAHMAGGLKVKVQKRE